MAKKNKGKRPQAVVMPKTDAERNRIKIVVDPCKVAMGHQSHMTGGGAHADGRKRRQRTRSAAVRKAKAEWGY